MLDVCINLHVVYNVSEIYHELCYLVKPYHMTSTYKHHGAEVKVFFLSFRFLWIVDVRMRAITENKCSGPLLIYGE